MLAHCKHRPQHLQLPALDDVYTQPPPRSSTPQWLRAPRQQPRTCGGLEATAAQWCFKSESCKKKLSGLMTLWISYAQWTFVRIYTCMYIYIFIYIYNIYTKKCDRGFFLCVHISTFVTRVFYLHIPIYAYAWEKKQHRIIIYTILWSPPTFCHFLPVLCCNLFRAFNLGPNFARGRLSGINQNLSQ